MAVLVEGLVGAEWFGSSRRWFYTGMVLKWLSLGCEMLSQLGKSDFML